MRDDVLGSGRAGEAQIVRDFAGRVRSGIGGGLVIVGEHGIGKSTVASAVKSGPGSGLRMRYVRAAPGERGSELAARLLQDPCAVAADSGGDHVAAVDPAIERLVTLTEHSPLLMVVDDLDLAHDSARKLLGYLARRVSHLPAGFVLIGWRRGEPLPAGAGVLRLHPLSTRETATLVADRLGSSTPDWVVDDVVSAAGGNPLAAREMSAALTSDEARGRSTVPNPPPIGPGWSARWNHLAQTLSASERTAMLIAAAGDGLPVGVLVRACVLTGADPDSLDSLESARLIRVDDDGRARARRPHRSAVYHCADPGERRTVHVALADALDEIAAPDAATILAQARHVAAATPGPDETVGDRLEDALRSADPSPEALHSWLRAVELTSRPDVRARRLVAAGLVGWSIGRPAQAEWLVGCAGEISPESVAGTVAQIRGAVALGHGLPADALRILVDGARDATHRDPRLAVDIAARVTGLAWWGGRLDWAHTATDLAASLDDRDPFAALVRKATPAGLRVMRDEFTPAVSILGDALRDAENLTEPREVLFAAEIATMAGDDLAARRFCERAIRSMRTRGRATDLPFACQLDALILAGQGRLDAARASADDGLLLAAHAGEETAGAFQHTVLAHLAALDGDHASCDGHRRAAVSADGAPTPSAEWAAGRLAVSQGRFGDAVECLVSVVSSAPHHPAPHHPEISLLATPDLVEAAVAVGRPEVAAEAVDRFVRWASAGSAWGAAVAPRLVAIVAPASESVELFESACRAPGLAHRPFESARTRLAYGMVLRGLRRRAEAREQLHGALGVFESLQLPAWIERTRSALRASGEGRAADTAAAAVDIEDVLTPQELEIARMVGDGRSNRDVAGALHLSSRTVEYHLSKVYVKLGLDSRAQLPAALAE